MVHNELHVDEFKSKMGNDEDMVVLSFKVGGKEPAIDLVNFIEKSYDWVIDADTSSGEMEDGDYIVFVEMERNRVDDDKDNTCSKGLHFCSLDYLNHFGGERIVILKINPRDVVSIPNDYNDSKGRACRYEIVDEIEKDKADEAFAKAVQAKAEAEASKIADKELANFIKAARAAAVEAAKEQLAAPTATDGE